MTTDEINKTIHAFLGRGCWHQYNELNPKGTGGFKVKYKCRCGDSQYRLNIKDGPDYLSPDLPHSTVVEIVTKAVERHGRWNTAGRIFEKAGLPFEGTFALTIPAPQIVTAVAEMEGK